MEGENSEKASSLGIPNLLESYQKAIPNDSSGGMQTTYGQKTRNWDAATPSSFTVKADCRIFYR